MDNESERIEYAARHTEVIRHPRQHLATFGVTNIYYYILSEPAYSELLAEKETSPASETVIREGRVIAERPKIVTPYYLTHLEGFSYDARQYFEKMMIMHGPSAPGLFYTYKNEPKGLNIVANNVKAVIDNLNDEIDKKNDPLTAIIKGQDDMWDVSLLKFIYEITSRSVAGNIAQMNSAGMLGMSGGIPVGARKTIEEMFAQAYRGDIKAHDLEAELNRWGAFEEYQDRFFALVKSK
jgi:hypothetical protein